MTEPTWVTEDEDRCDECGYFIYACICGDDPDLANDVANER
jgi:hypothetical protein